MVQIIATGCRHDSIQEQSQNWVMSAPRSKAFSLTPSHQQTNDVIDFNDKDDIKYYLREAKPLFYEHEEKFDCTPENLNNFIQALDEILQ